MHRTMHFTAARPSWFAHDMAVAAAVKKTTCHYRLELMTDDALRAGAGNVVTACGNITGPSSNS
jgi:hypothetical protein